MELACWYFSIPTSSVAAERTFGVMRAMEADNKLAMKDPAWRAELFLRVNKWLVDAVFAKGVAGLPKGATAGRSADMQFVQQLRPGGPGGRQAGAGAGAGPAGAGGY